MNTSISELLQESVEVIEMMKKDKTARIVEHSEELSQKYVKFGDNRRYIARSTFLQLVKRQLIVHDTSIEFLSDRWMLR